MDIETVLQQGIEAANAAEDLRSLDDVRVNYLGKKGGLTELLKGLGKLDPAERPQAGAKINEAKVALQQQIAQRKSALETAAMTASLAADTLDVTLPGRRRDAGGLHPVTQAMYRIESIFSGAAYEIVSGPEIENDYYNFEALNIPSHHPGTGDARHVLFRRWHIASHAYLPQSGAHHGAPRAADSGDLPRSGLSSRLGFDAQPDVPPSGRAGGG
jgi:phenylalanyl-tRNA synthetase alpha subunit